jgi:hypothetical protein
VKRDDQPEPRPPTPVLRVLLPRCPFCDGKKLTPYKRRYYGHFEIRYCHCDLCGANVNLRIEWPLTRKGA